jgi:serine/threonine protein kinase
MTDETIFATALEQADPAARAAYLTEACAGDPDGRRGVEGLLAAHEKAGGFLEKSPIPLAAPDHLRTQDLSASETDPSEPDDTLTFLTPPGRPDSLGRIGHYEVLEVLGKGGFGIVFRAFDETLQRVVAIKVLSPQLAATSPARKRFLREARSSAKVRHEHVVQVYAVEEQPLPYLVMEFIPGETLQQRLDRTGPLEAPEVLHIGRQIAEGLAAAHSQGLIHRDIKPGNILIEAGPQQCVKITDFGLARAADDAGLSQSGIIAGTPMYMAPEQAHGDTLDHRADLFSLGSVLYTMASGRPPFRANNTLAVLKRVAEDTPRPIPEIIPEVPPWLCDLIGRLHAKKPDDRIGTAKEVADLLGRGLTAIQGGDCHITPGCPADSRGRGAAGRQGSGRHGRTPNTRAGAQAAVPRPLLGGRCRRVPDASGRSGDHGSDWRHQSPRHGDSPVLAGGHVGDPGR